jgi:hypothetical protein
VMTPAAFTVSFILSFPASGIIEGALEYASQLLCGPTPLALSSIAVVEVIPASVLPLFSSVIQ